MKKVFLISFFMFLAGNALLISVTNYLIDPLQIFRKQTVLTPLFSEEQRYQVPGLINSYSKYKNIALIGDSMTSNMRHDLVKKVLGSDMLKLSIDGSTPYEQIFVAESLLSAPKAKTDVIIWSLDLIGLNAHYNQFSRPRKEYPLYMYESSLNRYLQYTLSSSTLIHSLQTLVATVSPIKFFRRKNNMDQLNIWDRKTGCELVFQHYDSVADESNWLSNIRTEYSVSHVNRHIRDIIKLTNKYPHVKFEFFFPPYSIVRYKYLEHIGKRKLIMLLRDRVGRQLIQLPNAHLHDVASRVSLITQLDYYKDIGHYSKQANKYILESIKTGQHVKSFKELQDNTRRLSNAIDNFILENERRTCNKDRAEDT